MQRNELDFSKCYQRNKLNNESSDMIYFFLTKSFSFVGNLCFDYRKGTCNWLNILIMNVHW